MSRDYHNPIKVDRDPEEDWTTGGHRNMNSDFEADPPLVKAARVWGMLVETDERMPRDVVAFRG